MRFNTGNGGTQLLQCGEGEEDEAEGGALKSNLSAAAGKDKAVNRP